MKIIFLLILITAIMMLGYLFIHNKSSLKNFFTFSASSTFQAAPKAGTRFQMSGGQSQKNSLNAPYGSAGVAPSNNLNNATTTYLPQISDYQIPNGFNRTDLSPYFGQVRISSAYYSTYSSSPSQIKIYASLQNPTSTIDVTDWVIKSNRATIAIPRAIAVYNPFGPFNESDIFFGANQDLNIYSNISAIGKNFRLNKCTGYLENIYKFAPSLPQNCPNPYNDRSEIAYLPGYCQNYITSLWGCKLPDVNYYNNLPGTIDGNACRDYLNTINHSTCFQKHQNDKDFFSNDWYIWINNSNVLFDPLHDRFYLFDQSGLLVDEYNY